MGKCLFKEVKRMAMSFFAYSEHYFQAVFDWRMRCSMA